MLKFRGRSFQKFLYLFGAVAIMFAAAAASASAPAAGEPLDLKSFLDRVREKHGLLRSFEQSRELAERRRFGGDSILSPTIAIRVMRLDDLKPSNFMPGVTLNRTAGTEYSVSLAKRFATGTQAELTTSLSDIGSYIPTGGGNTAAPFVSGAVGVTLSQSLWRDFFGRATTLRREREELIEKTELKALDAQESRILVEAEAAFWNWVYLKKELELRMQSLDRAQRIEKWVATRLSNGIGDRADLLSAQSLVALRELALHGTRDEIKANEVLIRSLLEVSTDEKTPEISGDLVQVRALPSSEKRMHIEAVLSAIEARTKKVVVNETNESGKPDLSLDLGYRTNSYEAEWSQASSKIFDTSQPTKRIGLRLAFALDFAMVENARKIASVDALAAEQRRERKALESEMHWQELIRRHSELSVKITAAEKVNQIQVLKATAEREKLAKGRSVTSQVIQAEQDAAESGLTLTKLQAEQRKLEAQSAFFIPFDGSESAEAK